MSRSRFFTNLPSIFRCFGPTYALPSVGMKIGILGYGRMGQLVEQIAHERGHSTIIQRVPADCDVCIDFSVAEAVQGHLEEALARSIPIVIGTTGWDSSHVPQLVRDAGGSCLVAPNFSTGIHQFH